MKKEITHNNGLRLFTQNTEIKQESIKAQHPSHYALYYIGHETDMKLTLQTAMLMHMVKMSLKHNIHPTMHSTTLDMKLTLQTAMLMHM